MDSDILIGEVGAQVIVTALPEDWWGAYDWVSHRIMIRPGLAGVQLRSVLFHELGHAWHRHHGTTVKQEREASEWAAAHLIDGAAFEDAVMVCEYRLGVAHILEVMPSDVDAYLDLMGRRNGRTHCVR